MARPACLEKGANDAQATRHYQAGLTTIAEAVYNPLNREQEIEGLILALRRNLSYLYERVRHHCRITCDAVLSHKAGILARAPPLLPRKGQPLMSDQDRTEYLEHLRRIAAELAILLDTYHLGEDQVAIQAAFDAIRTIRERLYREQHQSEAAQSEGNG